MTLDNDRVFRWLNFGSCLFRIAFTQKQFQEGGYLGMPLQVNTVWRREISSVMSDWDHYSDYAKTLPPSAFSEEWISSKEAFENSDLIAVDVILDIFRDSSLRFRRPNESGGISYDHIICNFPEEPPKDLPAEIGLFDCCEELTLKSWERFGKEISTPAVFVTVEHRDDVTPGYNDGFRRKLLNFQSKFEEIAKQFPHWLVVSLDDILEELGPSAYRDRHHPTDAGNDHFRKMLPKIVEKSGILRDNPGGKSLFSRAWNSPERGDAEEIDYKYIEKLQAIPGPKYVVGPERLARPVCDTLGQDAIAVEAFGRLRDMPPPNAFIVMKWTQSPKIPPWITGLVKKYPSAIIELPCLWRNRDRVMLGDSEISLREQLRNFGQSAANSIIDMADVAESRRVYFARCLLPSHTMDGTQKVMEPLGQEKQESEVVSVPTELLKLLNSLEITPVFGGFW